MVAALVFCAAGAFTQENKRSQDARELEDELDRLDRAFSWVNRLGQTRPTTRATDPAAQKKTTATAPAVAAETARPQTQPAIFAIGQRPPIQPVVMPRQAVSDEQIGQAIQKAVNNI